MMKKNYYISALLCVVFLLNAKAQDTTKPASVLPEFTIVEQHAAISKKIYAEYNFDSIQLQATCTNSLRDLLSSQTNLYIKSQTGSGLATISMNGGNANHAAILFNGFNLQSPVTGQTDLNLLPVFFIDNASLQHGGASGNWGSGAIGGSVILNSDEYLFEGVNAGYTGSISSLKNYFNGIKLASGKGKTVFRTKIFQRNEKNYFSFNDPFSGNEKFQESYFKQWGVLQECKLKLNEKNSLTSDIWYTSSERTFAPGMLQTENKSGQNDQSVKILLKYELKSSARHHLQMRNSFSNEKLFYFDSTASVFSDLNFISNLTEIESFLNQRGYRINSGLSHQYIHAFNDGYAEKATQNRTALYSAFEYLILTQGTIIIAGNVRQEITDGKFIPTVGTLGANYEIKNWITVRAGVSRNYRLPTLNDLYWSVGGNPDLLPESSFEQNAGFITKWKRKLNLRYELNFYHRNTTNWIIWLPSGNGVWTPQNILEVRSHGFNHKADIGYRIKNVQLQAEALWSYNISTNEKTAYANDNSVGKLLIYSPIYQAQARLMLSTGKIFAQYIYHYSGYRYISSDNTKYLNPYHLHDVNAGVNLRYHHTLFAFIFKIQNLRNEQYQSMVWQAMPGRNYQIQLNINFENKNIKP